VLLNNILLSTILLLRSTGAFHGVSSDNPDLSEDSSVSSKCAICLRNEVSFAVGSLDGFFLLLSGFAVSDTNWTFVFFLEDSFFLDFLIK
jgi:hypothetical protein